MDWTSTLAVLAPVTAFLCQLVGIQICFKIIKNRGTGDVSSVPFIAFFASAVVWLKYGFMMNNTSVKINSAQSAILQFIYICIYYFYCTNKFALHWMLLAGFMSFVTPIVYVSYLEDDADIAKYNMGLYCSVASVIGYASPLATLSEVVKQRSTQSISLLLCVINFMCAVEWALYGLAINDPFLIIPNGLGGILGLIQFLLFCLYGCKEKSFKTIEATSSLLPLK